MHFNSGSMLSEKNIKFLLFTTFICFAMSVSQKVSAQETEFRDTIVRQDIFTILSQPGRGGSSFSIKQSPHITNAFYNYIENASKKRINGFRVRIFFDNKQDAREMSLNLENSFRELYPGIAVYRTYTNPYFKVTVGDFRTRSDAMRLLKQLESNYQSAFIVREHINFPPL